MSSSQVIDSEKAAKQLQRFFQDASNAKRDNAFRDADSKRKHASEATDGRFSTTDAAAQMGRAMSHQEIQKRLLVLNRNLIFEDTRNNPESIGVYIEDVGFNANDINSKCRNRRFLVGMRKGISPEFRIINTKEGPHGPEFVSEIRSWRTVLRRLIVSGVISLTRATQVFELGHGRDSEAWFRSLE